MKFDVENLSYNMAELIGVIIGDGCVRYKPEINQYYVEIVGNINEEREYFNYLKDMIKNELNLNSRIIERERGLRMKIYSKSFVEFLVHILLIPPNKDKGKNVIIPEKIESNKILLFSCLRGIADTDGSLFLSKKDHRDDYPTIEITTTSKRLAEQLKIILSKDFRVGFRSYKRQKFLRLYIVSLNGEKMVDEWYHKIGFSNLRNLKKYNKLKNGDGGI